MPIEKLYSYIETFRQLKQKVLWKFENDTIPNLPSNVMIRKWLPQNDILAHKNVILFMTHGGVFGTQEGIYHGVPMLFMPIYSDQFRNAKRCVDAGYAEMLDFVDVSVGTVLDKLNIMLNNKKYIERAREVSSLFRDNPISPMDEAMYWIEYIGRHKGGNVFKSNAVNVPWYIYIHLDILAAILFLIFTLTLLLKYAIAFVLHKAVKSRNAIDEKKTL